MKSKLKFILYNVLFLRMYFRAILLRRNLVILDIDNTLANTREYVKKNHSYNWSNIERNTSVLQYLENYKTNSNNHTDFIAITVRRVSSYWKTKAWLKDSLSFKVPVFLAATQYMKVNMVKRLVDLNLNILFIDDFSYGIDFIEIYKDELEEIKKLEMKKNNFTFILPSDIN